MPRSEENNDNFYTSLKRTVVPIVVGTILATLAGFGIDLEPAAVTSVVTGLFAGGYYIIIRYLEQYVPGIGWLLGTPKQPSYDD